MKIGILVLMAAVTAEVCAQTPIGEWHDVSKDYANNFFIGSNDTGSTKPTLNEDYEVIKTHEICASVMGYFLEKSNQGRYNVYFKGMRTSATFTFTTKYDAEHWVTRFCTPESLLDIRHGRGTFSRSY